MLNLARQGSLSKPWRRRHQGPTCRGNKSAIDREASGSEGAELGQNGPGPIWPVLSPVRVPFDLRAPLYISSASADCHIHPFIREPPTRRRSTGRKPTTAASPRVASEMARTCPNAMVGLAWWSHGGVSEPMPWFHQGNCTFYIRWWYKSCLFLTLIYIDECFIHMYI
jgi:hypothetical protein